MRDFDEMKLARVVDACGGIDGRVKMQKIVYLLKAMGYDLPFDDFRIRQHGPFSRAVACSADVLKGGQILVEEEKAHGTDPHGEPILQYSYIVRDKLKSLIRESFDIAEPEGKPPVDEVGKELNEHDRPVLEVAATRVYLEQEDKLSGDALEAELSRLKGHLESHFADAKEFLAELRKKGWLETAVCD